MEPQLEERIAQLEQKIDAVYFSSEKSRKYLLTLLITMVVMAVLPIIAALFIVPMAISTLSTAYGI